LIFLSNQSLLMMGFESGMPRKCQDRDIAYFYHRWMKTFEERGNIFVNFAWEKWRFFHDRMEYTYNTIDLSPLSGIIRYALWVLRVISIFDWSRCYTLVIIGLNQFYSNSSCAYYGPSYGRSWPNFDCAL
jgi:hypothetical protein